MTRYRAEVYATEFGVSVEWITDAPPEYIRESDEIDAAISTILPPETGILTVRDYPRAVSMDWSAEVERGDMR